MLACKGRPFTTTSTAWTFDADTAIHPVVLEGQDHHHLPTYRGHLTDRWSVGDAPNGGYQMAMAISAARKELQFRDPLSVSVHFVAKGKEKSDVEMTVNVLHSARTSQTVQVMLSQEGALRSAYLMTFGDLQAFKVVTCLDTQGLNYLAPHVAPPVLPPVSECINVSDKLLHVSNGQFRVFEQVDLRMSKDAPFVTSALRGQVGQQAVLEGWAAFSDGRPPCLRSMALFNDAYPPPVLSLSPSTPWVPTTELTVHFWARPTAATSSHPPPDDEEGPSANDDTGAGGGGGPERQWLRVRFVTDVVRGGLLRADGEIWSADGGTLFATSRQLARLVSPKNSKPRREWDQERHHQQRPKPH